MHALPSPVVGVSHNFVPLTQGLADRFDLEFARLFNPDLKFHREIRTRRYRRDHKWRRFHSSRHFGSTLAPLKIPLNSKRDGEFSDKRSRLTIHRVPVVEHFILIRSLFVSGPDIYNSSILDVPITYTVRIIRFHVASEHDRGGRYYDRQNALS